MVLLTNYNSAVAHSARLAILSALMGLSSEIGYRLCSLNPARYSLHPSHLQTQPSHLQRHYCCAASRRRIFGKNRSTR